MDAEHSENKDVDISAEAFSIAIAEIKKFGSRSRKKRRRLLDEIIEYLTSVTSLVAEKPQLMGKLVELIEDFNRLILETLNLLLMLSEQSSKIDSLSDTAIAFADSLVLFYSHLKSWTAEDKARPSFQSLTSKILTAFLTLAADNSEAWYYSVIIGCSISYILWEWGEDASSSKGCIEWSKNMTQTMYELGKCILKCQDFTCQYTLVIVIQQWLSWAEKRVGYSFINTLFPMIDQSVRRMLIEPTNFDHDYIARIFLNTLNSCPQRPQSITSAPCLYFFAGNDQIQPPGHSNLPDFWIDFSCGSKRIHCYCSTSTSTWVDVNIRADHIESMCVSWARKTDSKSQNFTQTQCTLESQKSRLSNMTHEALLFVHLHLNQDFDIIVPELNCYAGKEHRSLFLVFKDISALEPILAQMQFPTHSFGENSCTRPRKLNDLLRGETLLDLSIIDSESQKIIQDMSTNSQQEQNSQTQSPVILKRVVETPGGFYISESDENSHKYGRETDSYDSWENSMKSAGFMNLSCTTVESYMEEPIPRSCRKSVSTEEIPRTPFRKPSTAESQPLSIHSQLSTPLDKLHLDTEMISPVSSQITKELPCTPFRKDSRAKPPVSPSGSSTCSDLNFETELKIQVNSPVIKKARTCTPFIRKKSSRPIAPFSPDNSSPFSLNFDTGLKSQFDFSITSEKNCPSTPFRKSSKPESTPPYSFNFDDEINSQPDSPIVNNSPNTIPESPFSALSISLPAIPPETFLDSDDVELKSQEKSPITIKKGRTCTPFIRKKSSRPITPFSPDNVSLFSFNSDTGLKSQLDSSIRSKENSPFIPFRKSSTIESQPLSIPLAAKRKISVPDPQAPIALPHVINILDSDIDLSSGASSVEVVFQTNKKGKKGYVGGRPKGKKNAPKGKKRQTKKAKPLLHSVQNKLPVTVLQPVPKEKDRTPCYLKPCPIAEKVKPKFQDDVEILTQFVDPYDINNTYAFTTPPKFRTYRRNYSKKRKVESTNKQNENLDDSIDIILAKINSKKTKPKAASESAPAKQDIPRSPLRKPSTIESQPLSGKMTNNKSANVNKVINFNDSLDWDNLDLDLD